MGFSRFQFSLNPQEEIEFVVSEEATYKDIYNTTPDLISVVKNRFPNLIKQGIINETFVATIKEVINYRETLQALQAISNENYNERNLLSWKAGSSVSVPTIVEGKLQTISLVPNSLLTKTESVLDYLNKKKEIARVLATHNDHINKIFVNQSRLRENIKSLEKILESDLVKRYLKDLDLQEDDLFETRKKIAILQEEDNRINDIIKILKMEISNDSKNEIDALNASFTGVFNDIFVEEIFNDFRSDAKKSETKKVSKKSENLFMTEECEDVDAYFPTEERKYQQDAKPSAKGKSDKKEKRK